MIHQYKLGGYNIVLDVNSGSIHVVDDVTYDIIADFNKLDKETLLAKISAKHRLVSVTEISECIDLVEQLVIDGKLFTEDTFADMAGKLKEKPQGLLKPFVFILPTPVI